MAIDDIMKTRPGSGAMFDAIAPKYDLLNEILSLGMHKRWRSYCIKKLKLNKNDKILDLAAGTLDISMEIAKQHKNVTIIAADPSLQMLCFGEKKLRKKNIKVINSLLATAERLPLKPATINTCVVSFGIRNFESRKEGLLEIKNALVKNGELAILELLLPEKGILSSLARIYIKQILPFIGSLFSKKTEYNYLQKSINNFPRKEKFINELKHLGFEIVSTEEFMLGTCHFFLCKKTSCENKI